MGFKHLTLANWTDPDPASGAFGRLRPDEGFQRMDGEHWAQEFLAVELGDNVPEGIGELFAVARGVMLYGWFFYPLFMLGEEQLHRVVETAVRARYRELEGPQRKPSFAHAIDWLIERGVIAAHDKDRWTAARELRNEASHPGFQSLLPPGMVLGMLRATAHNINDLFGVGPEQDAGQLGHPA